MKWFEKLQINVRKGDIFQSETEGLMITTTTSLGPYGNLSKEFFEKYAQVLTSQIDSILNERTNKTLQLGETVSVIVEESGDKTKRVILATLWQNENPYTPSLIYSVYINSLREAFKANLLSLSLPILKVPKNMLGEKIIQVLTDLNDLRTSETFSVEEIEFVSNNDGDIEFLEDVIDDLLPELRN